MFQQLIRHGSRLMLLLALAPAAAANWSATDTVVNPMNLAYDAALVRLKVDVPASVEPAQIAVRVDGQPVPHQIDEQGQPWVAATLEPLASATYEVSDRAVEAAVPSQPYDLAVLAQLKPLLGDAEPIADGPLFRRWRIESEAGHILRVTLQPGKPYALIEERGPAAWTLPLSIPGKDGKALLRRWYKGPFDAAGGLQEMPLRNDATRLPGAIVELLPRWTQSYDDGWFFGVTDGQRMVGALVLRAGQWRWPHDARLVARVNGHGEAELDGTTLRGARNWLLLAGPRKMADAIDHLARVEGFANLDKLHHDYAFAPLKPDDKPIGVQDFFSNHTNPTDMIRRWARAALSDAAAGKTRGGNAFAYEAQARFDADWYGRYEHGFSPINPNFFTDFMKLAILQAAQLDRQHPAYEKVCDAAERALRSDLEHSVTLPGGAGQECPGYQAHAAEQWAKLRPITAKRLGFDPAKWPRWKATGQFILHSSQPVGGGKRAFHPGGDTHPGRPDPAAFAKEFGYTANPRSFVTEELPGFGVIFRDRSGTDQETYLAFKAGPNRGHYHGDQLSFHLAFDARPAAVDHHASYSPRPGQEHMHNRLSFSTEDFPFANMDGYERLIAFKTSDAADVAIAQVESPRLRKVKELPPEEWDDALQTKWFEKPLTYRRTIVFIKDAKGDQGKAIRPFFVIRDQYQGPELDVTYQLHALGTEAKMLDGSRIAFDKLNAVVIKPQAIKPPFFKWEHDNGGREQTISPRITQRGEAAEFITVLFPSDERADVETTPAGVRVGDTLIEFGPNLPHRDQPAGQSSFGVAVQRNQNDLLRIDAGDIDLNRSQGDIGLFVPDVGYPFGPSPQWLIDQRADTLPMPGTLP